jgi:hypothetical protein
MLLAECELLTESEKELLKPLEGLIDSISEAEDTEYAHFGCGDPDVCAICSACAIVH